METNGNLYPVDHKFTASKNIPTYMRNFDMSMQVSAYSAYVAYKYKQCSGFIPNVFQVGYRAKPYKGEPAGFWWKNHRTIVNRYPEQIEDFKDNVIRAVAMLKWCKEELVWAKNENGCMYCEYQRLCQACDDEEIRELHYQVVDTRKYLKGD